MNADQTPKTGGTPGMNAAEMTISIVIYGLMAMLVANIWVLWRARLDNDGACKMALIEAALAAASGQDKEDVRSRACGTVVASPKNSLFVDRPSCAEFEDRVNNGTRLLKMRTQVLAHIPAPFLILNEHLPNGVVAVSRSYMVHLPTKGMGD